MTACSRRMGLSTKKSPCFCAQVRLSPIMVMWAASCASLMSVRNAGFSGLHRWERRGSSKLMM